MRHLRVVFLHVLTLEVGRSYTTVIEQRIIIVIWELFYQKLLRVEGADRNSVLVINYPAFNIFRNEEV